MQKNLFLYIKNAQNGDKESLLQIIKKIKPIMNKFSRQLNYLEAETDLIISTIEIIQKINLNKFCKKDEGAIINFIYNSLKNKKIDLFRKYVKKSVIEVKLNFDIIPAKSEDNIEEKIFIENLLNKLPKIQRKVISLKYTKETWSHSSPKYSLSK